MKLLFAEGAWEDYQHWLHNDRRMLERINKLIREVQREPFAGVGSRVKKGDVLCVVEAMKLMNEITADADGEVIDVCVQNGQVVEFGQILFKLY